MDTKTWLITGISSGLGKAIAQSVMEQGEFVIGTFRNQSQVDAFNKRDAKNGFAYLLDIANEKQIENFIASVKKRFKRIDVLVNNAGIGFAGAIEETSMQETRDVFESNFFGTLKLTQEVLPVFRKQRSDHIIQITSI